MINVIKFVNDLRQVSGILQVPPVSSTNKTDRHDITDILLKVALNTIKHQTNKHLHVDYLHQHNFAVFFLYHFILINLERLYRGIQISAEVNSILINHKCKQNQTEVLCATDLWCFLLMFSRYTIVTGFLDILQNKIKTVNQSLQIVLTFRTVLISAT